MDEMRGIINDVAGDLGSSLESTLVNAFKNGTNAAEDFKDVVNDVLQSMMMKELITPYFQRYFDKLQEDMEKSMDGGDGVWTDDVMRFAEDMSKAIPGAVTMMEEMDKALQGAGYKGFTGGDTASALTGGIKGMSEDTASILSGYINAIRIGQIEQTSVIRQQLLYMSEIAANTRYNSYLQSIDRRLATMANDNLRAQGLS
jgi:L-serine deaminase